VTDDIVRELRDIQRVTAGLQERLGRARSAGRPQVEATDRSGAIRVTVDADGLPDSVRVDSAWRNCLEPAGFATALVEACQAAAGQRMTSWSQALHNQHAARHQTEPAAEDDPLPAALRERINQVDPRPVDKVTEDVLAAFDRVAEFAAASPLTRMATGTDTSGRITVTVSKAGLVSCTAGDAWVSQQTGSTLATALNEALSAARAALAEALAEPGPAGQLDDLLAEALAILQDPRRFTDS
jgi:hypothetical protein